MKFNYPRFAIVFVIAFSAVVLISAGITQQAKSESAKNEAIAARTESPAPNKTEPRSDREEDLILEKLKEIKEPGRETRGQSCDNQACTGRGRASHFVKAKNCPNPCDPKEYKSWTDETAKERAKREATVNCRVQSHYDECECKGGEYALKEKGCIPVTILGDNYCEYFIEYEYKGTCKQK